jgi:hypothetical protein
MEWRSVFYISCGALTLSNLVFNIWGSAERQLWDKDEQSDLVESEDKKDDLKL